MKKIPFDEKEYQILYKIPNPFGDPGKDDVEVYDAPISHGENYKNTILKHESMWVPSFYDMLMFTPRCVPDNIARAMTLDGGDMCFPAPEGSPDMFGIKWIYVPVSLGSMPVSGQDWMEDANDWKERFPMPDIDSYDWEGQAKLSKDAVNNPQCCVVPTIFTGYFERLISFMEFENAAIAMIDEEQSEAVHELFDALTDLYCRFVDKYMEYFRVDGLLIHDDWGSAQATFFHPDVIETMILPYMKKLVDYCHGKGLFVELHSCGKVEKVVDLIIQAGFDTWTPQRINDVSEIYRKYGKKLVIGVNLPDLPLDCSEEEARRAAEDFVEEFVHEDAPVLLGMYSGTNPKVMREVYRLSRIKLAQI